MFKKDQRYKMKANVKIIFKDWKRIYKSVSFKNAVEKICRIFDHFMIMYKYLRKGIL